MTTEPSANIHITPLATVKNTAIAFANAGETEASIRANIFKSHDRFNSRGEVIKGNGLALTGAIIRRGRKVLINLEKYEAWLASETVGEKNGYC